jgi:hypothetical protein
MDKAYNTAIAIATVLVQNSASLSFSMDYYNERRGSFVLSIRRNDTCVAVISFTECLRQFGVLLRYDDSCSYVHNFNDVRFDVKDSDKMMTYIFHILEAYKVVA